MRTLQLLLAFCLCAHYSYGQLMAVPTESAELPQRNKQQLYKHVPFDLEGGLIFVPAIMDGQCDSFILDTGAPTLVINTQFFVSDLDGGRAVGLSGTMNIQSLTIRGFEFGLKNRKKINGFATDFSHLEQIKKRRIRGLIGYEVIRHQEMLIDYTKKRLTFIHSDAKQEVDGYAAVDYVKFKIRDHFPIVKVKIGKRYYFFGIDTGAEVNVLSKHLCKKLKRHCKESGERKQLQGLDQSKAIASSTRIKEFKIKDYHFENMEFVFADISSLNAGYGMQLDGILGYPFLQNGLFSINFKQRKLYFWEALNEEAPLEEEELLVGKPQQPGDKSTINRPFAQE